MKSEKIIYKVEDNGKLFCRITLSKSNKVKKEVFNVFHKEVLRMQNILLDAISEPNENMAKVYRFKKTSKNSYYYIMEYIPNELSLNEIDLVQICDYFFWNFDKVESDNPLLIEKNKKLFSFLKNAHEFYYDLHEQNIRVNNDGNYILIDYEGLDLF